MGLNKLIGALSLLAAWAILVAWAVEYVVEALRGFPM